MMNSRKKEVWKPWCDLFPDFQKTIMLIQTGNSSPDAVTIKIGPSLIFERLWEKTGIKAALSKLLENRKFEFDVERAIFMTVFHRLMTSVSDRNCDRWRRDYAIPGTEQLNLHHFYRAMAFLGEQIPDQTDASDFALRLNKDLVEEDVFKSSRNFSVIWTLSFTISLPFISREKAEKLPEKEGSAKTIA